MKSTKEVQLRCRKCGKLLMKLYTDSEIRPFKSEFVANIEIKCYYKKCKTINVFQITKN